MVFNSHCLGWHCKNMQIRRGIGERFQLAILSYAFLHLSTNLYHVPLSSINCICSMWRRWRNYYNVCSMYIFTIIFVGFYPYYMSLFSYLTKKKKSWDPVLASARKSGIAEIDRLFRCRFLEIAANASLQTIELGQLIILHAQDQGCDD